MKKMTAKLKNDIALTVSLVLTLVFIKLFMVVTNINFHESIGGNIVLLVLIFFTIKILYNGIMKLTEFKSKHK